LDLYYRKEPNIAALAFLLVVASQIEVTDVA